MLILILIFSLIFAQVETISPILSIYNPNLDSAYSIYNISISTVDKIYTISITRYVYPIRFNIISKDYEESNELVEILKNNTQDQICIFKYDPPKDYFILFSKKYEVLSVDDPSQSIPKFLIFNFFMKNHSFNQKYDCVKNYNISAIIKGIEYEEFYYVQTSDIPDNYIISIPELNLSLVSREHTLFRKLNNIDIDKKLSIQADYIGRDTIPIESLEPIFKELDKNYKNIYSITKLPYLSFGILVGVINMALIAIFGFITFIISVVDYYLKKNPSPIKKALGYYNPESLNNLIKWGLLSFIGIVVEVLFGKKIYISEISFGAIVDLIRLDIIFATAIIHVFFIKALYEFIIDKIKGLIAGQEYYTTYSNLITGKSLKSKLDELKSNINILRELIGEGIVEGVDVSKYLEYTNSIPINNLEQSLLTSDITELYELSVKIKNYNSKTLELINEYKNLKRDVEQNYKFWKEQLKSEINMYGAVSINNLVYIPAAWRTWFARKFTSENIEYVFSEGLIKKLDLPKSEILKRDLKAIFNEGYNLAILFVDGTFYYSGIKKTYIKAILTKILQQNEEVYVEGEKYDLATFTKFNTKVAIFGPKEIVKMILDRYK